MKEEVIFSLQDAGLIGYRLIQHLHICVDSVFCVVYVCCHRNAPTAAVTPPRALSPLGRSARSESAATTAR